MIPICDVSDVAYSIGELKHAFREAGNIAVTDAIEKNSVVLRQCEIIQASITCLFAELTKMGHSDTEFL